MDTIHHLIDIDTPADKVYDALTAESGLNGWWTTKVESPDANVGSAVKFTFEDPFHLEMKGSVDSLVASTDDLFELVQIDAGAIAREIERIAVRDAVGSAIVACTGQASEKGLAVQTHLNGAGATRCSPHVARVVQNLLQNAIRHTPVDGTITVAASHGPLGLELVVEDNGEGIAAQSLDRAFEPFWRGDSARSSPGSGLGLALVKRIVESLGGSVDAESAPASGSRFAVLLPDAA